MFFAITTINSETLRPSTRVTRVDPKDYIPVSSIAAAEDHFFGLAETNNLNFDFGPIANTVSAGVTPVDIFINRAANKIAAETRRAAGNKVFMNENTYSKFSRISGSIRPVETPVEIGRWTHRAVFNYTIQVYVGDHLPDNEIIVAYGGNNTIDSMGQTAIHNGELVMAINPTAFEMPGDATRKVYGGPESYIRRIRLEATQ